MTPQTKVSKNLHEIKTIVDDSDKKVHSIHTLYTRFNSSKLCKLLDSYKYKGRSVSATLFDLLLMTFTNQSVRIYVAADSSQAAKVIIGYCDSKSGNTISMIKRALRHRLTVDYILVDSWFMNVGLIAYVYELSSVYLLGMCKFDDRKFIFNGKEKMVKQLLDCCTRNKKIKRSRTIKARYVELMVE